MTRNQSGFIMLDALMALAIAGLFAGIIMGAQAWAIAVERRAHALYECVMYAREVYDLECIRLVTRAPVVSYPAREGVRVAAQVAPVGQGWRVSVEGVHEEGARWNIEGVVSLAEHRDS